MLLVDADLHKGTLERLTGLATAPEAGLAHLLRSWAGSLDAAVVRDTRTNLKILPAGTPAEDPSKLLASGAFAEILREARARYDAVIVDAPPVLSTTDSNVIACLADCLLLVVRWQSTPREAVQLALRELRVLARCQIGLVLNMVKLSDLPALGQHRSARLPPTGCQLPPSGRGLSEMRGFVTLGAECRRPEGRRADRSPTQARSMPWPAMN